MPVTVGALRTYGTRRVSIVTSDGTFDGHIDQERLSDDAIMVMLARANAASEPVVVALDAIEEIVER